MKEEETTPAKPQCSSDFLTPVQIRLDLELYSCRSSLRCDRHVRETWATADSIQGLRVVDASVMPEVICANTNATTIMIAERVTDWINEGK
jgi:GMC oxidoreductase